MGATMAELLLWAAVGYGLYRLLKPFQGWLEKKLGSLTGGQKRSKGVVIDVEPEKPKKGS